MIRLAMWLALISAIAVSFYELRIGRTKILSLGTTIYFFLMALLVSVTAPSRLWYGIPLMGSVALSSIVLISIIVRRPFTLQYAMETTPKERWTSPAFIRANYVITWAWFIAFVIMALPSAGFLLKITVPVWFNWAFSLCCMLSANRFTEWYKKRARSRAS